MSAFQEANKMRWNAKQRTKISLLLQ